MPARRYRPSQVLVSLSSVPARQHTLDCRLNCLSRSKTREAICIPQSSPSLSCHPTCMPNLSPAVLQNPYTMHRFVSHPPHPKITHSIPRSLAKTATQTIPLSYITSSAQRTLGIELFVPTAASVAATC